MTFLRVACFSVFAASAVLTAPAQSAEQINFVLDRAAAGEHAPIYHAKALGLYEKVGLDVAILRGKTSMNSSQRVSLGKSQLGIADLTTMLVAKGAGADLVAVMNIHANSPRGMYWKKSSGIENAKDFAGKKIGVVSQDATRKLWPALAKALGVKAKSVFWVEIARGARISGLKSGAVDVTASPFNAHYLFKRAFATDLGYLQWRKSGLNLYGNSIVANGKYLEENPKAVEAFVKVTQKAYRDCALAPEPCIVSLLKANKHLRRADQLVSWKLILELMDDKIARSLALGYFDPRRMKDDYKLVATYIGLKNPFDVEKAYTNDLLDRAVKLKK